MAKRQLASATSKHILTRDAVYLQECSNMMKEQRKYEWEKGIEEGRIVFHSPPKRERAFIRIMIMDFDMQNKSDSYFIHTEHTLSMNDYKELQKEVEIFKNLAWNYLIRNVTYEENALFNLTTDLDETLYDSRTNPEGCFDLFIDGFLVMVPHMRNIVTILERNSIIPYVFSHSKMIEIIEL